MAHEALYTLVRDVVDFPQKGVTFKDITPLLADPAGFAQAVAAIAEPYKNSGIDKVVGIESRGFIFGVPVAGLLQCGFIPVRKPGKLPHDILRREYALEYGSDAVEMHRDALRAGEKVLVVDDVLATGGTMQATCQLLGDIEAEIVGVSFLMELAFLHGREKLGTLPMSTVLTYK